jgi:hypothetical protein
MRTTRLVAASIAAASGVVALVGVFLSTRLGRCGRAGDPLSELAEVLTGFWIDWERGWALLSVAAVAAVGCAIVALAIGASLSVRPGIAATAVLVVAVTAAAVVGLAVGTVLRGCETIVAREVRDALVPMGVASLVGAAPGFLAGLGVAALVTRRRRLA